MIEAFVAYSTDDEIPILEKTMEAWAELPDVEPVGLKVKEHRYELDRRLTADSVAKNKWYLLVDLGTSPDGRFTIPALDGRCGLYGLAPKSIESLQCNMKPGGKGDILLPRRGDLCNTPCEYCDKLKSLSVTPTGVRICQRAVIHKWLTPNGGNYNKEHAESVRLSGKRVAIVRDVFYKSLLS